MKLPDFAILQDRVTETWGSDIILQKFIGLQLPAEAYCQLHNYPIRCKGVKLIRNSLACPCPYCKEILAKDKSTKALHNAWLKIIDQLKEMYKDKDYTYELAEQSFFTTGYQNRQRCNYYDARLVTVTCKLHGPFSKSVDRHKITKGCPACQAIQHGLKVRKYADKEALLLALENANCFSFDYSEIEYGPLNSYQNFRCKKHGPKRSQLRILLDGRGCKYCVRHRTFCLKRGLPWHAANNVGSSDIARVNELVDDIRSKLNT